MKSQLVHQTAEEIPFNFDLSPCPVQYLFQGEGSNQSLGFMTGVVDSLEACQEIVKEDWVEEVVIGQGQ